MMSPLRPALLLSLAINLLPAAPPAPPRLLAPGWEITLFASEPDIVTPVGLAVDPKGQVFAVENHTHQVKPDYPGPKSDRIKILQDTDGDGRADRIRLFAEGFTSSMNLAFDPDGVLHLVHRNGVIRLEDHDGDGLCDKQVNLLRLDTTETYPHNGLSGIAFSSEYIYIGSGENFGTPYTAQAADGSQFRHTPGGAMIFRMRRDGSHLEPFATGLWNAFTLALDGAGRLFVGDNDPDSRPPCRFLHAVAGADFGYQFQYGRSGLHPFVCWNGELPGTLPMVAGTGEAPTGLLDARLARLGPGRGQGFLMTEWGDSSLSWYRLQPRGASFSATREIVIQGDPSFRPACLAPAPDGSVYLSDWADREYSVHQKGRLWRLHASHPEQTPTDKPFLPISEPELRRQHLAQPSATWTELQAALTDPDPYILSAALTTLALPAFQQNLLENAAAPDPKIRQGVLLALRRAQAPQAETLLRQALADPDDTVRRIAMRWTAELRLKNLRPLLEQSLHANATTTPSPEDFALWLAALDLVSRDGPPTAATASTANDDLLQKLLADPATSPSTKAAVLPQLTNFKAPAMIRTLMALASTGEAPVRREALRSLAFVSAKAASTPLQKIALDPAESPDLRHEALAALAPKDPAAVLPLRPLLDDPDPALAVEAARALRPHLADPAIKQALQTRAASAPPGALQDQLALALGTPLAEPSPTTDAAWTAALLDTSAPASAARGRHLFFNPATLCSSCHIAEGRGAAVGPNLTTVARASDRARLITSILEPSREIGPLYSAKQVTLHDGRQLSGIPVLPDQNGILNLIQPGGALLPAPRDQIAHIQDTGVSLMPEGLELALTLQDFRDLLAYLQSLH